MNKDAFYFPHFSNARNDRKLRRVRKELGIEGYGIYFMVLETLRDQDGFKYPLEDLDLLAEEFGTSDSKIRTVVCNYKLFEVDESENFFSLKFDEYLQPYLERKEQSRVSGIKGNLIRHKHITKEQANKYTDVQIIEINEGVKSRNRVAVGGRVGGEQGGGRKESKVNKGKETKENKVLPLKVFKDEVLGLYEKVVLLFPEATRPTTDKQANDWKNDLRLLIEKDGYDSPTIEHVILKARSDKFWCKNFLSLKKLRQKDKNQIPYIVSFIEKFKQANNATAGEIRDQKLKDW